MLKEERVNIFNLFKKNERNEKYKDEFSLYNIQENTNKYLKNNPCNKSTAKAIEKIKNDIIKISKMGGTTINISSYKFPINTNVGTLIEYFRNEGFEVYFNHSHEFEGKYLLIKLIIKW